MSHADTDQAGMGHDRHHADTAPGDQRNGSEDAHGIPGYLAGLALAALLTVVSFTVAGQGSRMRSLELNQTDRC